MRKEIIRTIPGAPSCNENLEKISLALRYLAQSHELIVRNREEIYGATYRPSSVFQRIRSNLIC